MWIDMHAHTSGISLCCKLDAEKIIAEAKEKGFDGLVITNHYCRDYFQERDYEQWLERYIAEWTLCKRLAREAGLRCFAGVEVSMLANPWLHMLLYGVDENFLYRYPHLYALSQKELFDACEREGGALVQAHPFRGEVGVQDLRYLHGVEINCHPNYFDSHAKEVTEAAKAGNLALTVGCDYHGDSPYRALGGSFLPDEITTEKALASYLRESKRFSMQVHEPKTGEIYRMDFQRK